MDGQGHVRWCTTTSKVIMQRRGRFISFEGPEGGGKSSHVKKLAERLTANGCEVLITREPGGTAAGESIRNLLQHDASGEKLVGETELLLFAASRAQLVREVILPALDSGAYVVCDRFADSTIAYQGYGRQCAIEPLVAINRFAVAEAVPDLTFLLDIDVVAGLDRVVRRTNGDAEGRDRFEREEIAFHERVRAGYLELAAEQEGRFRVIDASREPDVVAEEIWRNVSPLIG